MKSIFFTRHINSVVIPHPRMPVKLLPTQQVIGSSKAVDEKLPSGKIRVCAVLTHTGSSLLTDIQFFHTDNTQKNKLRTRFTHIFASARDDRMIRVVEQTPGKNIKPEIILGYAEEITGVDIFPRNSNNGTHQRKKDIFGGSTKRQKGCSAAHESDISTFFKR